MKPKILGFESFFCSYVIEVKYITLSLPWFSDIILQLLQPWWGRQPHVLAKQNTDHRASAPTAFSNCKYQVVDTAVEVWQTVQECTKEMPYRNVKSLKEYFYGYYLKNALKQIAPPCLLQVPNFIYSVHQSHQTASVPVFYVPSLL